MLIVIISFIGALIGAILCAIVFKFALWKCLPLFVAFFIAFHALYLIIMAIVSAGIDKNKPVKAQSKVCRRSCYDISSLVLFYFGIKVKVTGEELIPAEGRFLFVSNHRSAYDPLAAFNSLYKYNIAFLSKPSNMTLPILGRIAYGAGCIGVDRENDRKALKSILQASDYISKDICSFGVYPEGTRSKTEELLPFRAGCFKIAQKAKVPVVIAATHGTEKVKHRFLKKTTVYIDIIETLSAEKVSEMSTKELSDYARDTIIAHLNEKKENRATC